MSGDMTVNQVLQERREHYMAALAEAEQDLLTAHEITSLVARRDRARRDLMVFREIEAAIAEKQNE